MVGSGRVGQFDSAVKRIIRRSDDDLKIVFRVQLIGQERAIRRPGRRAFILRRVGELDDLPGGEFQDIQIPESTAVGGIGDPLSVRAGRRCDIIPIAVGDAGQRHLVGNIGKEVGKAIFFNGENDHFLRIV